MTANDFVPLYSYEVRRYNSMKMHEQEVALGTNSSNLTLHF